MSKFEQMNNFSIVTKEIDGYLKENEFEIRETGSLAKREKILRRVYSTEGFVTYVSIFKDCVYIFREDDISAFLWDEIYNFEEDSTKNIEKFKDFMDEIYKNIF